MAADKHTETSVITSGPDARIESFLTKKIGCEFLFVPSLPLAKLNIKATRQLSREQSNSPDYVYGIMETMRAGGYISPLIVRQMGRDSYWVLDGIHRVIVARELHLETMAAYVVKVEDDEAELIASCINVVINGQGLSDQERRLHFLTAVRRQSPDVDRVNLRDKLLRQAMAMLSVRPETANRWVSIETLRIRLERLKLRMPTVDAAHKRGEHTEAWLLALGRFTDEELQKYWLRLISAKAVQVARLGKELEECQSTARREELIDQLMSRLSPSIRIISNNQQDIDRRAASQIMVHVGGLLKLAPDFVRLAKKFDDVRNRLQVLLAALSVDDLEDMGRDESIAN